MLKIIHVVGARPNFMKIAPIMQVISRYPHQISQQLVHTGQHYDTRMSQIFFDELNLPQPDINLNIGSGSHAWQTAQIMQSFEPVVREHKPDWVVVVGDVNSTLACALVSSKLDVRVAHVEAGLRSFDRTMPEEINRVLTDQISDLLFTTEESAQHNLQKEGIDSTKCHFVGNVMIDTLVQLLPKTKDRTILSDLGLLKQSDKPQPYVLVTLHRPGNVDNYQNLQIIISSLAKISTNIDVLFTAHPRTYKNLESYKLIQKLENCRLLEPLGYLDFLALQQHAALVITDSGGIQEETTYLGVPCLTIRPNTERPITITCGTNKLVACNENAIVEAAWQALQGFEPQLKVVPPLWDGHAAERIVQILLNLKS